MTTYFEYQAAVLQSDLSSKAKLTALAIASHYNWKENTPAWPSDKTLAKETGLSVRSITRAKDELAKAGFMTPKRRYDSSNEYTVSVPAAKAEAVMVEPLATVSSGMDSVADPLRHSGVTPTTVWRTNSEENHELNHEENNELKETTTPPAAAGCSDVVSSSSLSTEDEVSFSRLIDESGVLVSFASYVVDPLDSPLGWDIKPAHCPSSKTDAPAAVEQDELDKQVDWKQEQASKSPNYKPDEWDAIRADARRRYEAGDTPEMAVGRAMIMAVAW